MFKMVGQFCNEVQSACGDPSMPFGGARAFALAIDKNVAKGAISDPQLKLEGMSTNKLEFTASLQPAAVY
jgi:hypothetical protein